MKKTAVVLMNLGTPRKPTTASVKAFLKEFLSDRRVVEVPRLLWWFILRLIILPFRSPKVARAYQTIWQEGDSPLRLISQRQAEKLQQQLQQVCGEKAPQVCFAMTYAGPALADVVAQLRKQGVEKFLLLPLYPQYSATTTGSIYDQVAKIYQSYRDIPDITVIKQYYDEPNYIAALACSVQRYWQQYGQGERLLLSFHGLPQAYVDKGDPYYQQCLSTAERVAKQLGLTEQQWQISFQSRLGKAQWLQPYTSELLQQWGREKISRVDVVCPAFSVDCLETLEEISGENKQLFVAAGGGDFHYIPCLNDCDQHIEMMQQLVLDQL